MKKYNLLIVVFLCVSINALKATPITFNDPSFKAAMVADPLINLNGDLDIDDVLEAAVYSGAINVSGTTLLSPGFSLDLAYFTQISGLICSNCQLSSLDLTNNTQLQTVDCSFNLLGPGSLILPNLTWPNTLNCSDNPLLNSLDVSLDLNLNQLNCSNCGLSTLILNQNIYSLNCQSNTLSVIDLTNNNILHDIDCSNNPLTSLIFPSTPSLSYVGCNNTNLINLSLATVPTLTILSCENNTFLTSIDLASNNLLSTVSCRNNIALTSLNISNSNNSNIPPGSLLATGNPLLHCIAVSDLNYCMTNLSSGIDPLDGFSLNCSCVVPFNDLLFKNTLVANTALNSDLDGVISCSEAAGITGTLDVSNLSISDLSGIEYFTSITILDCSSNNLTYLDASLCTNLNNLDCSNNSILNIPSLPPNLYQLLCSYNQLSVLPVLPGTLIDLGCDNNSLTTLGASLPNLSYLDCSVNQLNGGLPSLPGTLTTLKCSYNSFSSGTLPALPLSLVQLECELCNLNTLPTSWPTSLSILHCGGGLFTTIPALPNTLTELWCNNTPGLSLPVPLPSSLGSLAVGADGLTSLPSLPSTLNYLECSQNQLTSLPTLPSTLYNLSCEQNQLSSLPNLPFGLTFLNCRYNSISCMPVFPSSITGELYIWGNPYTCLQNYLPIMEDTILAKPLCDITNALSCPVADGIVGYTYEVVSNNNQYDVNTDIPLKNVPLNIKLSGVQVGTIPSASNGVYDFPFLGTYDVGIATAGLPFDVTSANPVTLNNLGLTYQDFTLGCKASGYDLGTHSIVEEGLVFPGELHSLKFIIGDLSAWYGLNCTTVSGQVEIKVTGPISYSSPAPLALTPTSISGTDFIYNIADFSQIDISKSFGLILSTNNTAQTGAPICVTVIVTSSGNDYNTSNNNYTFCYPVVNSYDPNEKEVYPQWVAPGYNDYFTYTIHFQNTGNAPAINIHIVDTLDNNLDLSTFEFLNYSHYSTALLDSNVLTVKLPNIQLVDSTTNFANSQGFIQYRIKPKAALPTGTQIFNNASIYFDFNAPVVTNTVVSEYVTATSIASNNPLSSSVVVAPNPTTGYLTLTLPKDDGIRIVKIYNVLGEIVYQSEILKKKSTQGTINTEINLSENNAGIYLLRVFDEHENVLFLGKVVKE